MKNTILAIALFGALASTSFAQINHRLVNQQNRIAAGIRDRQLTPGEVSHLENREARVDREIRFDRNHDGGHLTPGERFRINHQLNSISRNIYRDRHY
jgi:hypothetical protein